MNFGQPEWFAGLWGLPVLAGVLSWMFWRQRVAARTFSGSAFGEVLVRSVRWGRRRARAALVIAAAGLLVLALARPRWDPREETVQRTGRDVVFLVDVSRSMLAADLAPSRLERAKLWIKDLVASLGNDRVGLVAFAGTAVVKCPLTVDTSFFNLALEGLGPDSVSRGGTMIGDAIRKTLDEVITEGDGACDIILFTDGEDQESFPVEAAGLAAKRGIRLIALGLGSDSSGGLVPGVTYNQREVVSRLNAGALAQVAAASAGGVYLNVGTGTIDLERVYADLAAPARKKQMEAGRSVRYREGFGLFLGGALALLLMEVFVSERRR
jgi:Ca-activated chloride channel family protein